MDTQQSSTIDDFLVSSSSHNVVMPEVSNNNNANTTTTAPTNEVVTSSTEGILLNFNSNNALESTVESSDNQHHHKRVISDVVTNIIDKMIKDHDVEASSLPSTIHVTDNDMPLVNDKVVDDANNLIPPTNVQQLETNEVTNGQETTSVVKSVTFDQVDDKKVDETKNITSSYPTPPHMTPNDHAIHLTGLEWVKKQSMTGSFGARAKHTTVSFINPKQEPCILIFGGQSNMETSNVKTSNSISENLNGIENSLFLLKKSKEHGDWQCFSPAVKNLAQSPPKIRYHSAVYFEGRMYVFGGKNNLRYFDQLYSLNCETWEWSHIVSLQKFSTKLIKDIKKQSNSSSNSAPIGRTVREQISFESLIKLPCKRSNHTAVVLPKYKKMLIHGGKCGGEVLGDLWSFDLENYEWDHIQIDINKTLVPSERHSHAATTLQENPNIMLFYGGTNGNNQLNDLWMFDISSRVFTPITLWNSVLNNPGLSFKMNDSGASHAVQVATNSVFGKKPSSSDTKNMIIPQARTGHSFVSLGNGYLMVHGGYSNRRFCKDFVIIDLQKMEYIDCSDLPRKELPCSRKSHTMTNISDEYIALIGGVSRKRGKLGDFELIDKKGLLHTLMNDENCDVEDFKSILKKKFNLVLEDSIRSASSVIQAFDNIKDLLDVGSILLSIREYSLARECFSKVCSISPKNVEAIEKRAVCSYMIGEYVECIEGFNSIEKSTDQMYDLIKALCYVRIGQYRSASTILHTIKQKVSQEEQSVLFDVIRQIMEHYESSTENKNKTSGARESRASQAYYASHIDDYVFEPNFARYIDLEAENKTSEESNTSIAEPFSLLFIGEDKSGLTSYLQQIRTMFRQSVSLHEAKTYKNHIQSFTAWLFHQFISLKQLLQALDKEEPLIVLSPELSKNCEALFDILDNADKHTVSFLIPQVRDSIIALSTNKEFVKVFTALPSLYGKLSKKYYFTSLPYDIHKLFFTANTSYFLNETSRILQEDYLPTDFDIVAYPEKTHFHPLNIIENELANREISEEVRRSSIKSTSAQTISDDMFTEDISLYRNNYESLNMSIEKLPLEFMFRRTPYTIFSTRTDVDEKKVTSAIKELSIDAIVITVSLADIDQQNNALVGSSAVPSLNFLKKQVIVDGKSNASIVNIFKKLETLFNAEEFADTQICIIFTHLDVFNQKVTQDPSLLNKVFPKYSPNPKKPPLKYLEEVFELFNSKHKRRRRFHYSFVNTFDKEDVRKSFKNIHEVVYSVELKRKLDMYKML